MIYFKNKNNCKINKGQNKIKLFDPKAPHGLVKKGKWGAISLPLVKLFKKHVFFWGKIGNNVVNLLCQTVIWWTLPAYCYMSTHTSEALSKE